MAMRAFWRASSLPCLAALALSMKSENDLVTSAQGEAVDDGVGVVLLVLARPMAMPAANSAIAPTTRSAVC